jgi:hypothetical protein
MDVDMEIQHGHGFAAWALTYSTEMDMQRKENDVHHGRRHAPWTWTYTTDMDIHPGYRHAPWI